jgi:hypothetical protein
VSRLVEGRKKLMRRRGAFARKVGRVIDGVYSSDKLISIIIIDSWQGSVAVCACAESEGFVTEQFERNVRIELCTHFSLKTIMSKGLGVVKLISNS